MNEKDGILYETIGHVARIWLDRAEMRNAQDSVMLGALETALDRAAADPEVRAVVIGGKGEHFSAGHDLKEARTKRAGFNVEQRWNYEERYYYDCALKIWDLPKPVIAQVQGACIAGGFMIANSCDMVIAAEDAFFSDPVIHSLAIAGVEVLLHPWVMNPRKAKEFLMAGTRMSAPEALDCGMVNRVVPRARLEEEAFGLASRIAEAPPFAIRMAKRSINRTMDMQGMRASLAAHFDTHQLCHTSQEFRDLMTTSGENLVNRGKRAVGG